MLDTLTKESFDPLKGDAFSLAHNGGTTLSLSLVAVLGTGLQGHASREQFAIHFLGPAVPVLPQCIYQLHHQTTRRARDFPGADQARREWHDVRSSVYVASWADEAVSPTRLVGPAFLHWRWGPTPSAF